MAMMRSFTFVLVAAAMGWGSSFAAAQALQARVTPAPDVNLSAARDLYTSAAYEEALELIAGLRTNAPAVVSTEAEVLRAFCLLALQREDEAQNVIEDVITERPMYLPSTDEASPRVREAFREVRRRLLPSIARQLYDAAKASHARKEHVAAAAQFGDLLKVLDDPDLAPDDTIDDLRLLAQGFRDISLAASELVATAASLPPVAPVEALPTSVAPAVLTPPTIINQQLPPWRAPTLGSRMEFSGAIDLVISEDGTVESVSLRRPIHPLYDETLLKAAREWTYEPARIGDRPVKFQKTLVVKLNNQ